MHRRTLLKLAGATAALASGASLLRTLLEDGGVAPPRVQPAHGRQSRHAGRARRVLPFIAALLLAGINLSCTPAGSGPSAAAAQCPANIHVKHGVSLKSVTWIISERSIALLQAGASRALIDRAFNNSRSYVYGATPSALGVPTAYYTSYAKIKAAFKAGKLPGRFKAVIYDNERWPGTPLIEQRHPARYEQLAGRLLRQYGLMYIATPTPDLTWSTGNPREDSYKAYLQRHIAGRAARYAQVFDVQGQVRETNLREFTSFNAAAARQASEANPQVVVVVGIRTNPSPDTSVTATTELIKAYNAVTKFAKGFWLNVNGHPKPAICLLEKVYGHI